jgi:hypothetical protein
MYIPPILYAVSIHPHAKKNLFTSPLLRHNIHQLRRWQNIRHNRIPDFRPLLKRIRQSNQELLAPLRPHEADPERQVRRNRSQISKPIRHNRRVRGVLSQGHCNYWGADQGGEVGAKFRGEEKRIEGVVLQRAGDAERTGEVDVGLVRGPEARVGVVEAEGEAVIPDQRVALRPVFEREGVREALDVGERFHARRVVGELAEIFLGQVGDEVGFEDDVGVVAVVESVVAGKICVLDNGGAGGFEDLERGVEDRDDGCGGRIHGEVDEVAGDAEAFAFKGREFARADVVGDGLEGDGGGVVVVRVFAGDGVEQVRGIFDGASQRADGVLVFGDGNDEAAGCEADGGLDADEVVDVGWREDGAVGFGPEAGEGEAERAGHGAARRRT